MAKGGFREGGGRRHGSGKYGEKTAQIRVPLTLLPHVKLLLENYIDNGLKVQVVEDIAPNLSITFSFY